jgi:hypothetical protein
MLFRRDTLEAFASVTDAPHAYLELFVPTVVYHLGFDVADHPFKALDALDAVRAAPG